jgi:hypothetical protein
MREAPDHRSSRKALFQGIVLWFPGRQAQPPGIIVDDDRHVVGMGEGFGGAVEGYRRTARSAMPSAR